jgi:hypothetical protein
MELFLGHRRQTSAYEKDDLSEVIKSHFPELVAAGDSDGTQPKKKKRENEGRKK